MAMVLMAGAAIDGSGECNLREVPETDVVAFERAGFRRLDDAEREHFDWIIGSGWRYSKRSDRFNSARLESPVEGESDGENVVFVFSSEITAVTRNGMVSNPVGTIAGSTFTFNTAPDEGDEIKALVGVG